MRRRRSSRQQCHRGCHPQTTTSQSKDDRLQMESQLGESMWMMAQGPGNTRLTIGDLVPTVVSRGRNPGRHTSTTAAAGSSCRRGGGGSHTCGSRSSSCRGGGSRRGDGSRRRGERYVAGPFPSDLDAAKCLVSELVECPTREVEVVERAELATIDDGHCDLLVFVYQTSNVNIRNSTSKPLGIVLTERVDNQTTDGIAVQRNDQSRD